MFLSQLLLKFPSLNFINNLLDNQFTFFGLRFFYFSFVSPRSNPNPPSKSGATQFQFGEDATTFRDDGTSLGGDRLGGDRERGRHHPRHAIKH